MIRGQEGEMVLTTQERIMFQGIQAREQNVELISRSVREDLREVLKSIQERLGLPPGAIGTTHSLDSDTWTVVPLPSPPDRDGPDEEGVPVAPPEGGGGELLLQDRLRDSNGRALRFDKSPGSREVSP